MVLYIALILIGITIFMNYYLGRKLYKEPQSERYFDNVKNINTIKLREIMTSPSYIILVSLLTGIAIGGFIALAKMSGTNIWVTIITCVVISILYLIEITRRISLKENAIELKKAFMKDKVIPLEEITGMYIYTYNKKLLDEHAFTTKLVITYNNKKYKYTLGGIDPKAVLNMMKDNFNVNDYKIYMAK